MRPYTGELAGVSIVDGVPAEGTEPPADQERWGQAVAAYCKRHGLVVVDDRLMVPEDGDPPPPDPRDIGTNGDGIEPLGTRLRDAAVDPRPSDFLPPTNAGEPGELGNPHGPHVVAPEIHGTSSRAVTPGPVATTKPAVQESVETADAVAAREGVVLERPADSANKPEWVTYALTRGANADDVGALTKADLIEQYGGDA